MKWYRITHLSDNIEPFWAGARQERRKILTPVDCEEKSDDVATLCCAHLFNSIDNGIHPRGGHGVFQGRTHFVI